MKKIFFFVKALFALVVYSNAQNTSPYWSLAGNSNASASSKLGTTNSIPLRLFTNNTERVRIDATGRVGIGITSPVSILTVKSSGGTPKSSWLNAISSPVFAGFSEGINGELNIGTASSQSAARRAVFQGKRSRGTLAAPTAVVNNDFLLSFVSSGYDGSTFQNPATIDFFVDGTPSAGNVPARISLVTGTNIGNRTERLKVGSTGNFDFNSGQVYLQHSTGFLGIGTTVPSQKLHVAGNGLITGSLTVSTGYYINGSKVLDITGTANTFVGNTGNTANTGTFNTFVGSSAGRSNGAGAGNLALGASALVNSVSGSENVALGRSSMFNNINGSFNTAVGNFALVGNTRIQNTGVGYFALANTTASEGNTALGFQAGNSHNNGYYNCFLGSGTGTSAPGFFNVIAIGQGTICTAPSQVTVGNSATNSYRAYAGWANISDGRFKKSIKEDVPGLSFINKLKPITYNLDATGLDNFLNKNRKEDQLSAEGKAVMIKALKEKEKVIQTGFVAQDVEKAAKEVGYDFSGIDVAKNENDVYGLKYTEFVVPLVKAVQELSGKNDELKKEVNELKLLVEKLANQRAYNTSLSSTAFLKQNYPNPFNSNTVISYFIPENAGYAQIKITDAKGRVLKTFNPAKGDGQLNIRSRELPAGTYNYTLYIGNKNIDTKQMVLLK